MNLAVLAKGIDVRPAGADCEHCGLRDCPIVEGAGPEKAKLVVVGEAPGTDEVLRGVPFVGRAGRLLDKALAEAGVGREAAYITNACLCRPWPHRAPVAAEVKCCRPRLISEIKEREPEVVLTLGSVAMKAVLPGTKSIEKEQGTTQWSDELGCFVVPAIHPAAILRSPERYRYQDLVRAVRTSWKMRNRRPLEVGEEQDGVAIHVLRDTTSAEIRLLDVLPASGVSELVAVDVETNSRGEILSLALCKSDNEVFVLAEEAAEELCIWFNDYVNRHSLLGHNLKYDVQVLWRHGVKNAKVGADTMLMHYVLDERQGVHGLKDVARRLLHAPDWEAPVKQYKKKMEECPPDALYRYNALDAWYTWRLYHHLSEELDEDGWRVLNELLIPGANVLARMEYTGIRVDEAYLDELAQRFKEALEAAKRDLFAAVGREFNPNSLKQLAQVLYNDLDLPIPGFTKSGQPATDEDALKKLRGGHLAIDAMLRYRKAHKFLSTYVEGIRDCLGGDGRVHTTFNLHGTVTGRLSSARPNLQNQPKAEDEQGLIRNAFIATPGYQLIQGDLSQAEVRVLAWFSQDKNLIAALESGQDIHTATACLMFKKKPEEVTKLLRTKAKRATFGVIYGITGKGLAELLSAEGVPTPIQEAEELISLWLSAYPQVQEWITKTKEEVLRTGRVKTPFGRVRRFDVANHENEGEILKQAVNMPIQSVASDLTLNALIRLGEMVDWDRTRLLVTVHDSILLETREDVREMAEMMKSVMEDTPGWFDVPIVADVEAGGRWGSLEKIEKERLLGAVPLGR